MFVFKNSNNEQRNKLQEYCRSHSTVRNITIDILDCSRRHLSARYVFTCTEFSVNRVIDQGEEQEVNDAGAPVAIARGTSQPSVPLPSEFLTCSAWNLFQNEKCHLLVEHETQKLKALDESHNQNLKEWREKLRPRKKVTMSGLVGSAPCCATGVCLGCT